jgi:hypothetical protein
VIDPWCREADHVHQVGFELVTVGRREQELRVIVDQADSQVVNRSQAPLPVAGLDLRLVHALAEDRRPGGLDDGHDQCELGPVAHPQTCAVRLPVALLRPLADFLGRYLC